MMDLWAVQVTGCNSLGLRNHHHSILEKRSSFGQVGVLEISVLKRKSSVAPPPHGFRSVGIVKAMAKKNNNNNDSHNNNDDKSSSSSGNGDRSVPEGHGSKGDGSFEESNDTASRKSHRVNLDWREFRANLFAREQAEKVETNGHNQGGADQESKPLGLKWAHPIPVPECGCVLVATEKLDSLRTFERSVVLLLRSATRHPEEGPYGIVINRPLDRRIKHMKPANVELATTFADCSLHFGGPVEASMLFLLKTGEKAKKLPGFKEVIPGLCFGTRSSLDEAAALVKKGVLKPQDVRFFVGYTGWQLDQLKAEIESEYWFVAACSSNLIYGASESSSENLWEEILQLMGGHYSELSRKPKQDL